MARGMINYVVIKANGDAVANASAQINVRGGGAATLYTTEAGATTTGNPALTDAEGRIVGWLDEGSYDITVSGANITTASRALDILKGGGTFAEAAGSVTTNKFAAAAVTNPKIAANSVSTAVITNGNVTADKVLDSDKLGITGTTVVRRGKSIIAASGTTSSASPANLTNGPDQVASVVLPTDGIIVIGFQATWKQSVASSAQAVINIGAGNQLLVADPALVAPTAAGGIATIGAATNTEVSLGTWGGGLSSSNPSIAYTGDVTTGQAIGWGTSTKFGGPCHVFAAAGTYTINVQFWTSTGTGTITVTNRKLWVWTIGF